MYLTSERCDLKSNAYRSFEFRDKDGTVTKGVVLSNTVLNIGCPEGEEMIGLQNTNVACKQGEVKHIKGYCRESK